MSDGNKLVPISSLDMVGQTAFKNTKSLNRIQSIVCDAAYRTSENLLVCAPTGAGKTNVAMLCILQVRSNLVNEASVRKATMALPMVGVNGTGRMGPRVEP